MAIANIPTGSRLAYVVVELEGTLLRPKLVCETKAKDKDGRATMVEFKTKMIEEPAGFMVYFPRGHALRLRSREELAQYGLHPDKAQFVNLQGLQDPNSPVGKMLLAQDANDRSEAMDQLKAQVIQLATAKSGPVLPADLQPMQAKQQRKKEAA